MSVHAGHDPHAHHRLPPAELGHYTRSVHAYPIPALDLVDMDGATVSLASELNRDGPVLLDFIFTTCPTVCPVLSATFSQVQDRLGKEGQGIRMVSISIDPEQDSPQRLKAYAERFHATPRWRFLTGRLDDVTTTQRAFDAYRGNKMSHVPLIFLRTSPAMPWVRLEGFATTQDLVREYRKLVAGADLAQGRGATQGGK